MRHAYWARTKEHKKQIRQERKHKRRAQGNFSIACAVDATKKSRRRELYAATVLRQAGSSLAKKLFDELFPVVLRGKTPSYYKLKM